MSRVGNPYDNAKAESFIKTLKHEEVDGRDYRDLEQARQSIGAFIEDVYNRQRLHSALAYRPPAEFVARCAPAFAGPSLPAYGTSRSYRPLSAACARITASGFTPICSATASSSGSSEATWSSTPARKRRIGGGLPNHVRADPCEAEEPAEPLGVLGQETERLNREIFPEFPRVRAAFRHRRLPFRNVSPLGFY